MKVRRKDVVQLAWDLFFLLITILQDDWLRNDTFFCKK